jgi:response regulator RpfG family c-di-GMP phosphodiesterase
MAEASSLPRVLFVDDEPAVLEGLRRQLYREVAFAGASSGGEALALLERASEPFAAIVCDMRMPGINGVEVLAGALERCPETVRILLTGQADLEAAIAAVNEGNVFRFLVKPCPSPILRRGRADAVKLFSSLVAERELLEETLHGAVAALVDALALANPTAFARATRIRAIVRSLLSALKPPDAWRIEVATMLSQIGTVVLAPETVAKLHGGRPLTEEERAQVADLPRIAERVLAPIPRLEEVRRIIRDQHLPFERLRHLGDGLGGASLGARILRVATDLDTLEASGVSRPDALAAMARRSGLYDPALLELLAAFVADGEAGGSCLHAIGADSLYPGLTIAKDVLDGEGRLIIGRGYLVTESLIDRLSNWQGPAIAEPIFVYANGSDAPTS